MTDFKPVHSNRLLILTEQKLLICVAVRYLILLVKFKSFVISKIILSASSDVLYDSSFETLSFQILVHALFSNFQLQTSANILNYM